MQLKTVNVIVIKNNCIETIDSFTDDIAGNQLAEQRFVHAMAEKISNFADYSSEEIEACIENGYEYFGTGSICLSHSECDTPATGLHEILTQSDAVEIDGCFIRHFHYDVDSDDDGVAFEACMVDEEYQKYEWLFSQSEIKNASYDPLNNAWIIDEFNIKTFSLQPLIKGDL